MTDLIKKNEELDLLSIFKWFNSTGYFSYQKEREKLPVDQFTLIAKDTIQNIEIYGKSLRLNIDDEVIFAALIEKSKKEGMEITTSYYGLSEFIFNRRDFQSYKNIKDSLNALKTSITQLEKNNTSFIFSFIDSLKFDDNLNEKGKIKIRLSKEIYEFFKQKNQYLIAFNIKNYRCLTGGRIQKLLYFYFLSVNLTMPTPLAKIKEILKLNHIKLKDFKKSFTQNLINVLAKEGVFIKLQGDNLIYKRTHQHKLIEPRPVIVNSEPSKLEIEDYLQAPKTLSILETLKIRKSYILSFKQKYPEDAIVKSVKKLIYLHTSSFQEIKNPAGFLQKMLENGTYADIDEIQENQNKKQQIIFKDKEAVEPVCKQEINLTAPTQDEISSWVNEKISELTRGEKNGNDN